MASPGAEDGGISDAAGDSSFPAADIDGELDPGLNKHVEIDPVSSEVAESLEIKEQARRKAVEEEREEVKKKNEAMKTLKTAFMISGVIAVVAVAAFAIAKKLKEN